MVNKTLQKLSLWVFFFIVLFSLWITHWSYFFVFLHFSFLLVFVNPIAVCDCTRCHNPIIFRSIDSSVSLISFSLLPANTYQWLIILGMHSTQHSPPSTYEALYIPKRFNSIWSIIHNLNLHSKLLTALASLLTFHSHCILHLMLCSCWFMRDGTVIVAQRWGPMGKKCEWGREACWTWEGEGWRSTRERDCLASSGVLLVNDGWRRKRQSRKKEQVLRRI